MLIEPDFLPTPLKHRLSTTVRRKKNTPQPPCWRAFLCGLPCLFNVFTPFYTLKYTYFRLF